MIARANNAEYLRQLRVKAAAEGKCYQCRCRPTKVGCKSCQECLTRSAKVKESHRGIKCRHCSVALPPKRAGFIYCARCADRAVKRNAVRVQSLIASGMCGRCGRGHRHGESSQCLACLETMRLRILAHYREAGVRPGGHLLGLRLARSPWAEPQPQDSRSLHGRFGRMERDSMTLWEQLEEVACRCQSPEWFQAIGGPRGAECLAANAFVAGWDRDSHDSRVVLKFLSLLNERGWVSPNEPGVP